MIRIRVDLADSNAMADIAVASTLPVATLIPELIALFPDDVIDSITEENLTNRAIPAWRLRLASGAIADFESSLEDIGVRDGDRITLVDDPGPIPVPRVLDVADALSEQSSRIDIADRFIGTFLALATSASIAIGLLHLSTADYILATAAAFVCTLLAAAVLRVAIIRHSDAHIRYVFSLLVLVFSAVTGFSFVGVPLDSAFSDWRAIIAATVALGFSGLVLAHIGRFTSTIPELLFLGTAATFTSVTAGAYTVALYFLGVESAVALTIAFSIIATAFAPALAVSLAGIRIPHIPAAGEAFAESDDPNTEPHPTLATRASLLLDGMLLGLSITVASLGVALVTMDFSEDRSWALALAVSVAIVTGVQSRGHARIIPSIASALVAGAILLTIGWDQWHSGRWILSVLIALPLLASVLLPSIPATRISPSARRALEFTEAAAIAVSIPLAAVIADFPELVQEIMQ